MVDKGLEPTLALPAEPIAVEPAQTLVLPAGEKATDRPGTEQTMLAKGTAPGTPVPDGDRYMVLDEIGRGGLGRVVRAKDKKLDRTVAIKQLHQHDDGTERRFMGEALVTARLQHPSIVPIYDTGRDGDAPFYAMKLIDGRSLAEVLEDKDTLAARLPLVSTVLAVANAIAYAHNEKVIHRDLKPHNVIVGEFGETIVIDWGLAKHLGTADAISLRGTASEREPASAASTPDSRAPREAIASGSAARRDRESETMIGDVLGTPAYMPPEQAKGEVLDERADVFALGAMLYQVLAGRAPYAGGHAEVTLGLARLGKSPPLESLVDVPPDLLAIVNKAMAFEAQKRYATAREFAEDLGRYQAGQLVGSHRYTNWQLFRRWVRRHRGAVGVGTVLVGVLAVASTFFVREIQQERDVAETRRNEAETRRVAAEELVGFMLSDLRPGLARLGRLDLMRGVAKQVDSYYARVGTVDDLDPTASGRYAEAIRTLGDVHDAAGDVASARKSYEAALAYLAAHPGPSSKLAAASTQVDLVIMLQQQGELDAAATTVEAARSALHALPANPDVDYALSRAYRQLGILQIRRGKLPEATTALETGLEHANRVVKLRPGDKTARKELAKIHDRLSDVRRGLGDHAKAGDAARTGLAIREQLQREDAGDVEVLQGLTVSWDKIHTLAIPANDLDLAQRSAENQLAIAEQLAKLDPDNKDWARMLLVAAQRPAELAYARDDFAGAARLAERPLAIAEQLVDRDRKNLDRLADLQALLVKHSELLARAKQFDRGIAQARRALTIAEDISTRVPSNHEFRRAVGVVHEYVGDVYAAKDDASAAAYEYRARLAIDEELLRLDPTNPRRKLDFANTQFILGRATSFVPGEREAGVKLMQTSMDAFGKLGDEGHLTLEVRVGLAEREQILDERKKAK